MGLGPHRFTLSSHQKTESGVRGVGGALRAGQGLKATCVSLDEMLSPTYLVGNWGPPRSRRLPDTMRTCRSRLPGAASPGGYQGPHFTGEDTEGEQEGRGCPGLCTWEEAGAGFEPRPQNLSTGEHTFGAQYQGLSLNRPYAFGSLRPGIPGQEVSFSPTPALGVWCWGAATSRCPQ